MARSAIDAGYEVTIYARWHPGLPPVEQLDGYRLVRAPFGWRLLVPGLRGRARRGLEGQMAEAARAQARRVASDGTAEATPAHPRPAPAAPPAGQPPPRPVRTMPSRVVRLPFQVTRRAWRGVVRRVRSWRRAVLMFPLWPMAWATSLDAVAEPADVWHGMWAGSLPALARMRRRHGGRPIYDSRDIYMQSREFARLSAPVRSILARFERRWARSADRVLTVNDAYAEVLIGQLGIPRPTVVMNCPEPWTPAAGRPDLIRRWTGLPPDCAVALYQGKLMSDRGIEQAMDAILEVPGAALVLLGFGDWERRLTDLATTTPYRGRVFVLPAVPPSALLDWTASADVMVMAIQPTSINHRLTTPQKLFEAIAAGVPVVASDLPGMASIVTAHGLGELCDPTDPSSIAAGIRRLVDLPPDERAALRARILRVAHERYAWSAQVRALFGLYAELAPRPVAPGEPGGVVAGG
jgi:glycogen(starch) synthase